MNYSLCDFKATVAQNVLTKPVRCISIQIIYSFLKNYYYPSNTSVTTSGKFWQLSLKCPRALI